MLLLESFRALFPRDLGPKTQAMSMFKASGERWLLRARGIWHDEAGTLERRFLFLGTVERFGNNDPPAFR